MPTNSRNIRDKFSGISTDLSIDVVQKDFEKYSGFQRDRRCKEVKAVRDASNTFAKTPVLTVNEATSEADELDGDTPLFDLSSSPTLAKNKLPNDVMGLSCVNSESFNISK